MQNRFAIPLILTICLFAIGAGGVSHGRLNELLDERTVLNKHYKKQFIEDAAGFAMEEKLKLYEGKVADAYLELIEYAKQSDDTKLKKIVLRMEYYDELRGYVWDVDAAQDGFERAAGMAGIITYEQKLKELEK
ncbi:hypothetical protein [Stratiformator vulcanicus]|uniref:Uncharacterized protein n=1 Tax=Stratiformator vulcanicus TaxID=2527980 RepID=A0A517R6H9_9PLAN|nr:hypothetical protein [Stratiformator vulcanicus]QDT39480.1 hypothetical protein Pan189_38880 [Stratiformator vulcanicus]